MRLILETRLRSYVLDLSAHDNQAAPDEGSGAESLVETAGAPQHIRDLAECDHIATVTERGVTREGGR